MFIYFFLETGREQWREREGERLGPQQGEKGNTGDENTIFPNIHKSRENQADNSEVHITSFNNHQTCRLCFLYRVLTLSVWVLDYFKYDTRHYAIPPTNTSGCLIQTFY